MSKSPKKQVFSIVILAAFILFSYFFFLKKKINKNINKLLLIKWKEIFLLVICI